jgi:hypothetical protein
MATGVVGMMMALDITVMYLDMAMRVPMGELRRKLASPVVVVRGSLFLARVDSLGYFRLRVAANTISVSKVLLLAVPCFVQWVSFFKNVNLQTCS